MLSLCDRQIICRQQLKNEAKKSEGNVGNYGSDELRYSQDVVQSYTINLDQQGELTYIVLNVLYLPAFRLIQHSKSSRALWKRN